MVEWPASFPRSVTISNNIPGGGVEDGGGFF